MTVATVLFSIWTILVICAGTFMNYLAGLTGMSMIISASGIIVTILEIIMILIGLMFLLLYKWSCKKTYQMECFFNRKKKAAKRKYNNMKANVSNYKEEQIDKAKLWYDKQWFALESIPDEESETNTQE